MENQKHGYNCYYEGYEMNKEELIEFLKSRAGDIHREAEEKDHGYTKGLCEGFAKAFELAADWLEEVKV